MVYFNVGGTSVFQSGTADLFGEMRDGLCLLNGGGWGGGMSFFMTGGRLGGVGQLANDVYHDKGTLSPGQSPGRLEIKGEYRQAGTNAALLMEIARTDPGTAHDQVVVSGDGTLSGILTVELLDGYTPLAGTRFDILCAGKMAGRFATTNLPALNPGLSWLLLYRTNGVQLRVASLSDTDGDALDDGWEVTHFGSIVLRDGGEEDYDGDLYTDYYEQILDTQPTNSFDYFKIAGIAITGDSSVVTFHTGSNAQYTVELATNLFGEAGSWTVVQEFQGPGGDIIRTNTTAGTLQFYRIKAGP